MHQLRSATKTKPLSRESRSCRADGKPEVEKAELQFFGEKREGALGTYRVGACIRQEQVSELRRARDRQAPIVKIARDIFGDPRGRIELSGIRKVFARIRSAQWETLAICPHWDCNCTISHLGLLDRSRLLGHRTAEGSGQWSSCRLCLHFCLQFDR